jgi:putative serine protease PepD
MTEWNPPDPQPEPQPPERLADLAPAVDQPPTYQTPTNQPAAYTQPYPQPSYAPQYAQPSYAPQYAPPPPTNPPQMSSPYGNSYGASAGGYGYGYQPAPVHSPYAPAPAQSAPAKRTGMRTVLLAAGVAAVVGGGIGAGTVAVVDHNNRTTSSGISISTTSAQNSAKIDGTVTAAAAKIQPSVVTINVASQNESGTGSGVILRTDGYILTNNHVVSVAGTSGQIQVITNDGQSGTAKIVGTDASDDLAVIKVDGLSNLTKADFASSSTLQVGQTVVAVGAPLGLSNTVTSGIVSNTARPVQTGNTSSGAVFDAIQTDAAINPGNSGGPLVNLNGDVVGINAAIATANSGGVQVPGQTTQSGSIGIGFAIPSDEASRIASELITNGKATHAILGVEVAATQQSTSIATTVGAQLSKVTAGGPAAKAGLQVGDLVTKAQTQLIASGTDLVAAIRSFAPNQTITLSYQRVGVTHEVKVTLGSAPS